MTRKLFIVSDGTGITAETIGHSLLTQFEQVDFEQLKLPFIDTPEKAAQVREQINAQAEHGSQRPIVIATFADQTLSRIVGECDGLVLDILDTFLTQLEKEFGADRRPRVGQTHGLVDYQTYESRMDATNYALKHDDGADVNYESAEVILVGVSRSGKTPTCLYLALHYGIKAANYPLTEEDLGSLDLPKRLKPYRRKLFGLTIDPNRLQQIRQIRRPDSRYATLKKCQREVAEAEALFRHHRIENLSTTHTSVEEIAAKILVAFNLQRNMF